MAADESGAACNNDSALKFHMSAKIMILRLVKINGNLLSLGQH
jgi:hypothetical protein